MPTRFTAKFYDEKTGHLLEEVVVNGKPIRAGERIPNVASLALAQVTRVDPAEPTPIGRKKTPMQKVWVRDWFAQN